MTSSHSPIDNNNDTSILEVNKLTDQGRAWKTRGKIFLLNPLDALKEKPIGSQSHIKAGSYLFIQQREQPKIIYLYNKPPGFAGHDFLTKFTTLHSDEAEKLKENLLSAGEIIIGAKGLLLAYCFKTSVYCDMLGLQDTTEEFKNLLAETKLPPEKFLTFGAWNQFEAKSNFFFDSKGMLATPDNSQAVLQKHIRDSIRVTELLTQLQLASANQELKKNCLEMTKIVLSESGQVNLPAGKYSFLQDEKDPNVYYAYDQQAVFQGREYMANLRGVSDVLKANPLLGTLIIGNDAKVLAWSWDHASTKPEKLSLPHSSFYTNEEWELAKPYVESTKSQLKTCFVFASSNLQSPSEVAHIKEKQEYETKKAEESLRALCGTNMTKHIIKTIVKLSKLNPLPALSSPATVLATPASTASSAASLLPQPSLAKKANTRTLPPILRPPRRVADLEKERAQSNKVTLPSHPAEKVLFSKSQSQKALTKIIMSNKQDPKREKPQLNEDKSELNIQGEKMKLGQKRGR